MSNEQEGTEQEEPLVWELAPLSQMDVEPGDIVVLMTEEHLSEEAIGRIREHLSPLFPGHVILVLDGGSKLGVVRQSEIG